MTIFGTRPEIIRLSVLLKVLDEHCEHTTVHTGQNYDESLSDIFIRDLEVRTPDVHLGIRSSGFGDQAGQTGPAGAVECQHGRRIAQRAGEQPAVVHSAAHAASTCATALSVSG